MRKKVHLARHLVDALLRHVEKARGNLAETREGSDESIHDARKVLKQARAALRLLRSGLTRDEFDELNASLRDAGAAVSAVRDAIALDEAFARLKERERKKERLTAGVADHVQSALAAKRFASVKSLHTDVVSLHRNVDRLTKILPKIRSLSGRLEGIDLAQGLRRQYKKTVQALRLVRKTQESRALHEWRKQVKYLYNAVSDVMGADAKPTARFVSRAEKLADVLGDEHDLAEMERWLIEFTGASLGAQERDQVVKVIALERQHLRRRALRVSRGLFTRSARGFARDVLASGASFPR